MNSLSRLLAVFRKELLQLLRDHLTFGMIVGIPLVQLVLFGFAINTDVRHLSGGVADESGSALAREYILDIAATQVVDFERQASDATSLRALLDAGEISIGLYLPPDFERRVRDGRPAAQLLVDGSDPVILGVARQLVSTPVPDGSRAVAAPGQDLGLLAPDRAQLAVLPLYNPERRSAIHIVPGLIGVILTMTMVLFTAVAIVRERERGNLELLIATPIKPLELMLGKILPYVVIGLVQVSVILSVGALVFGVPLRGALPQVYLAALLFIATNLSLGLLISTAARNQFQAMQMTFFFFLPSILLSGFMFPFDGMPAPAQWFAELLPLTHFNRIIRGILLRGAELGMLVRDLLALLAFLTLALTLAVLRFSKRLD